MPTSGVTAWSLTARDICTAAAQEIGVIGSGETLTAEEMSDCIVRLNALLKTWSTKGNLFREASADVTITADDATIDLPADVRDVSAARVILATDNERPIFPWNRAQYLVLPNKTASGSPTAYYVEKGVAGKTFSVWPVPTEDTTVRLDYSRIAETVTDEDETLDIPEEWHEAVYKNLAVRIAPMFGTVNANSGTLQVVAQQAAELERQFFDQDRPDSYQFEPYDGYYY